MPRVRWLLAALMSATVVAALAAPAGAADTARYWTFADRRAREMDPYWFEKGYYTTAACVSTTRINANMLALHALAAGAGHEGPARNDARARSLVDRLLVPPAWTDTGTGGQKHAHGWTGSLSCDFGDQHVSLDPQVADALAHAYRARTTLGLTPAQSALIAARVSVAARSRFFRWPTIRLNQFNWQAAMSADDYAVSRSPTLLRADYRHQLDRFVANARRPAPRAPWLTDGLGLRYLPQNPVGVGANMTSTSEYGGIVLGGLEPYDVAVRAGMRPLPEAKRALLHGYLQRQLYGEWTHAGYLNWDAALGYQRWHLLRYWPLAASGLLAAASTQQLSTRADRQLAVYLIDRALDTYERWDEGGLIASTAYGMPTTFASKSDRQFIASRWAAIAARAANLGFREVTPRAPRAWFAADRQLGRLAVSTDRYWTALTPTTPAGYGGIEPARLHDGRSGTPLTGMGGRNAAALGLRMSTPSGDTLADTQAAGSTPRRAPWTLSTTRPRGPFTRLAARTTVRFRRVTVQVRHEFRPTSIRSTHTIRATRDGRVSVRFPVWGARPIAGAAGPAVNGQALTAGGYEVHLDDVPAGARLSVLPVAEQRSAPGTRRVVLLGFPLRAGQVESVTTTIVVGEPVPAPSTSGSSSAPPA